MAFLKMIVTAPPGSYPGQEIEIATPQGTARVRIPAGVQPGGQFIVNIATPQPDAVVQQQPRSSYATQRSSSQYQQRPTYATQRSSSQYRQQQRASSYARQGSSSSQKTSSFYDDDDGTLDGRASAQQRYQQGRPSYQPVHYATNNDGRQQQHVLASTGEPVHRRGDESQPCGDGECYKCRCCPCYVPWFCCCCCFCTKQVTCVSTGSVAIVEKFGKFQKVAEAGELLLDAPLMWLSGPCNETVAKTLTLRVQELTVSTKTKTKDNVFVDVEVVVMYRMPDAQHAYDAAYKLTSKKEQVGDFVEDVLRSKLATLDVDEVFKSSRDIAQAVFDQVADRLREFGFELVTTLVTSVEPDARVRRSMNEINTQKRLKEAQIYNAEADKAVQLKRAEAAAECKYLQGVGLGRMRKAIIEGLAESVDDLDLFDEDATGRKQHSPGHAHDATTLLMITQYMDALEGIGRGRTVTNPHGTGDVDMFLPIGLDALTVLRDRLTLFKQAYKPEKDPAKAFA